MIRWPGCPRLWGHCLRRLPRLRPGAWGGDTLRMNGPCPWFNTICQQRRLCTAGSPQPRLGSWGPVHPLGEVCTRRKHSSVPRRHPGHTCVLLANVVDAPHPTTHTRAAWLPPRGLYRKNRQETQPRSVRPLHPAVRQSCLGTGSHLTSWDAGSWRTQVWVTSGSFSVPEALALVPSGPQCPHL